MTKVFIRILQLGLVFVLSVGAFFLLRDGMWPVLLAFVGLGLLVYVSILLLLKGTAQLLKVANPRRNVNERGAR